MDPLGKDLPKILEGLHAIVIGTRDANRVPSAALGAALSAGEDGRVTVYVPEVAGAATVANAASEGVIAVAAEYIATHRTVQVKGNVLEIRDAREDERELVERMQNAFFDDVALIGAPAHVRRRRRWPCHAITFQAREVYEQTPGPRAGLPFAPAS
jgi:hypothetical protein